MMYLLPCFYVPFWLSHILVFVYLFYLSAISYVLAYEFLNKIILFAEKD